MDLDCKKFAKDVRSLDKEMKGWDAFVGLDDTVKNMVTSLRAVSELQNPAIRNRHWQQLMQATQVPRLGGAGRCSLGTRYRMGGADADKAGFEHARALRSEGPRSGLDALLSPC